MESPRINLTITLSLPCGIDRFRPSDYKTVTLKLSPSESLRALEILQDMKLMENLPEELESLLAPILEAHRIYAKVDIITND